MDASRRRGRRRSSKAEERVVVACPCGQLVPGSAVRWIELPSRLLTKLEEGTLDELRCSGCGATHAPARSVTVHDAKRGLAFLVLPAAGSASVVAALREHLDRIAAVPDGGFGAHLLSPRIVVGAKDLTQKLDAAANQAAATDAERSELVQLRQQLEQQAAALEERATALAAREDELQRSGAAQREQAAELERLTQASSSDAETLQRRVRDQALRQERREAELASREAEVELQRRTLVERGAELEAERRSLHTERNSLQARDAEVDARAQEILAQARDLEERGGRLRARAKDLDRRSSDLGARQQAMEKQAAELLAREVRLLEADEQLPAGDGLYDLPAPKELAPLSEDTSPGIAPPGKALDIELVPGAVPELPDDAPSLDSLQYLGAEGSPDEDERSPTAPPSGGTPASGPPASLDELVRAMPERAAGHPGLHDVGALATPAGEVPAPSEAPPAATSPPAVSEDGEFLEGAAWTSDMDAAWDLADDGVPRPDADPNLRSDTGLSLHEVGAAVPVDADREATRRVHVQDIAPAKPGVDEVEARARSHEVRPLGPFDSWDAARALGGDRYLAVHEGEVYLCLRGSAGIVSGILERSLDLLIQLHALPAGAAVLLELVGVDLSGLRDEVAYWWVDHRRGPGRETLLTLARSFRPSLVLFDDNGAPVRMLRFERPLEANALRILERAAAWERDRLLDVEAVRTTVLRPEFDRLGQMEHPFHQDAFARIETPAQSRFTLGVLGYWLQPDNRDYLVFIKSFPEEELETLTKRLLRAAMSFGIALPPALEGEALRLGLSEDERGLLAKQLANFAEVSLRIKPNDLDELQEWENWEALLTRCEAAGQDVDDDIVKLAERSMLAVQRLTAPPAPAIIEEAPAGGSASYLGAVAAPPPLQAGAQPPAPVAAQPAAPSGGWPTIQTPAPETLVAMLSDDAMARDALDALASMGAPGTDALVAAIGQEPEGSPRLEPWLQALVGLGPATVGPLAAALEAAGAPRPTLDSAVAALLRGLGEPVLAQAAAELPALRMALERVVLDEALRASASDLAESDEGRPPAGDAPAPTPPPPPGGAQGAAPPPPPRPPSGAHAVVPPPPPPQASQPEQRTPSASVWSGELEALLGVSGEGQKAEESVDDDEIIIDDDDIIEEVEPSS